MKKALIIAAALSVLSLPALAQSTPSGTSAGGPGRVGIPGQIGGGVPGSQPNVVERRMKPKKMMMRKKMRKTRMKKKMM